MSMKLQFLGATGTVTGSKYLLDINNKKVLIDCGLFQGFKSLRERNWAPLPVMATEVLAVLLTHAHIDHSGYIPRLVNDGFIGPIFASHATNALCKILLPDSGYLQEEDARLANLYGYSKHIPALPLYTALEAEAALKHFREVEWGKPYAIHDELFATWSHAGHILGASTVECRYENTKLLFSGDLGRPHDPLLYPPATMQYADYLVLESTYGNQVHSDIDPKTQMGALIRETAERGGSVLIPAFAVGRAQNILYYLYQLKQENAIPNLPIYLDSPMAISASKLLGQFTKELKLSAKVCEQVCTGATYVNTFAESQALHHNSMPKIIISASGMASGGRVLSHLKLMAPKPQNTILFTGFQAADTRGAKLLAGATEIKIHGQIVPVHAKIASISNTSAHADSNEILSWLRGFVKPPRQVFITHGEPEAALALKEKITAELGWNCSIPEYLEIVELN